MAIFDETPNTAQPNAALETLVGEGKKYKTVEDLALGRINADNHIATLEQELAELRSKSSAQGTIEELIRSAQLARQAETPHSPQPKPADTPPTKETNVDDLAARIREITRQDREAERTAANLAQVRDRMVQVFGDDTKAAEMVRAKAAELGVSPTFLQEVAAKSPKAFFDQMRLDDAPKNAGAPRNEVNPVALGVTVQAKPGTHAWYQELKKSNLSRYRSPEIQLQMFKDRAAKGEAFYGS